MIATATAATMPSSPSILFSDTAATKVRELLAEDGNTALQLRIYVSGGGCFGYQYGFSFEEAAASDDIVIERHGVQLLVDPVSLEYLSGAEVDFQDDLDGSRFVIRHPNARSTCSCGNSFSMLDNGDGNADHADGKRCSSGAAVTA